MLTFKSTSTHKRPHAPLHSAVGPDYHTQRFAYVWAESEADALKAVLMPPGRCQRYADMCDAFVQRDHGNDGYDGEVLFRVSVEEVQI